MADFLIFFLSFGCNFGAASARRLRVRVIRAFLELLSHLERDRSCRDQTMGVFRTPLCVANVIAAHSRHVPRFCLSAMLFELPLFPLFLSLFLKRITTVLNLVNDYASLDVLAL